MPGKSPGNGQCRQRRSRLTLRPRQGGQAELARHEIMPAHNHPVTFDDTLQPLARRLVNVLRIGEREAAGLCRRHDGGRRHMR